jgi:hypothetical protein
MVRSRPPAALAVGLLLAACTASSDEVRPPNDQLFFPTGIAVSPDVDQKWLFVTSANNDLRFDSGAVNVIDLDKVDAVIAAWVADGTTGDCERDSDFGETLVCEEAPFLLPDQGVRIGNFASSLAVQSLSDAGDARLLIPVRGDPSVTWVDWNVAEGRLRCDGEATAFGLCDDDHRLSELRGDPDLPEMALEPFGVFADSAGEFAVVTHLFRGAVTLVDSPRAGTPVISDALEFVFVGQDDIVGSVALAGHPTAPGRPVYIAGRSENRVVMMGIERQVSDTRPVLVPSTAFPLDGISNGSVGDASDSRGLAFDASGERMFIVNRSPAALHVYDTAIGATGAPNNRLIGGTDLCGQASNITVGDAGDGERAFVTCFSDGEVWVVDPRGRVGVESFVQVGRGPYGVAFSAARKRLYVSNFLENTVAVVDLTPNARTRHRVVLRIGDPGQ